MNLTTTDWIAKQLDAEVDRTRGTLERVPEGRDEWKPHAKSMPLGRLAVLVAQMPGWVDMIVNRDDLDLNPPGGSNFTQQAPKNNRELVQMMEGSVAKARAALAKTNDEHLMKPWRLLVSGKVVSESPRYIVLRDTLMHLAHHRGQLTVYLRLNDAPVPAIYGPSADDQRFA
jgi:uncharacterized damage-inducible protein DinB